MANKFLKVDYDKFASKTVTSMKDEYDVRADVITVKARLRHVSMPNLDSLVLDLNYVGDSWFFLRYGDLTININDVENIVLEAHESYTDTYSTYDSCRCVESDWYELNQELLKKICDAKSIDFKIAGSTTYDIANGNRFIKYAQKFYNGFYDEEAYKEVLEEPKKTTPSETSSSSTTTSENNSRSGCMVTLLMAIGALSSLAACFCFCLGIF